MVFIQSILGIFHGNDHGNPKSNFFEILPLVWQFGLGQASGLHVELPPRILMFKKDNQMLMVCSELNYHISCITKTYLIESEYFLPELSWSARPLGPCHQQSLY